MGCPAPASACQRRPGCGPSSSSPPSSGTRGSTGSPSPTPRDQDLAPPSSPSKKKNSNRTQYYASSQLSVPRSPYSSLGRNSSSSNLGRLSTSYSSSSYNSYSSYRTYL